MNAPKEKRNISLVKLRLSDPQKWSWTKIAKKFQISRPTAIEIFKRDTEKYGLK